MENIMRVLIAGAVALVVILGYGVYRRVAQWLAGSRLPTTERLLRPPGEFLSRKLAESDEHISLALALLIMVPIVFALASGAIPTFIFLVSLLILMSLFAVPFLILANQRRNYTLGLLGERTVGEELNQLLRDGCHVFHDYPGGPNWNIDHIVVAPSGVYAIETKTRRKRRAPKGRLAHEVIFDGSLLHFPGFSDRHGLEQARRNAVSLARELTSATGDRVKVIPVLTLPRWLVTLRGKSDVHVLCTQPQTNSLRDYSQVRLSTLTVSNPAHRSPTGSEMSWGILVSVKQKRSPLAGDRSGSDS